MSTELAILTAILTIIGSFIGAALATWLSLQRFYREKMWERKVKSYTLIFESLCDMLFFYQSLTDNVRPMTPTELAQAKTDYDAALEKMYRRLLGETWLFPDSVRQRLFKLTDDIRAIDFSNLQIAAAKADQLLQSGISDLRSAARRDLNISSEQFGLPAKRHSAI